MDAEQRGQEDRANIERRAQAGQPVEGIARAVGWSQWRVRYHVRKAGLVRPVGRPARDDPWCRDEERRRRK